MRDYLELYLVIDVCLLAYVFETYRATSKKAFNFDLAHFVSPPSLVWNALHRFIKRTIELICEAEMDRMITPSSHGCRCHVSVKYAHANNEYMGSFFRPEIKSSFIFYYNTTNLYGHTISQALPYGEFGWLSEDKCRPA